MKKQWFVITITVATAITALFVLFWWVGDTASGISTSALAAPAEAADSPTVTAVDPAVAPNDLDTPIAITGTGFTAGMSGTLVITQPTAYLGVTALEDVGWVSSATLTATVPWGLDPGVYTVTVVNPGGESGMLPNAFTVTQGIGVWTTGGPYGGMIEGLVLNPVTSTTVYALAHNAGVFASYDGAAHWQPILLDENPNRLVFDAEDPQVMYFGSGDDVLRTQDGGSTWEEVSPPWDYDFFHPAAHPESPGVIYVGSSSYPEQPDPMVGGLFRSNDYGETWVTLTVGLTDSLVMDIAFHPDDPDTLMVGTQYGNVFISTNGGETWNWRAKVSLNIERLYFNPFGSHEAWATTGERYYPPHYLYKSEDPELEVWTPITVAGGNVVHSLTFLTDTIWSAGAEGFTSTDGGANWSMVSTAGLQPGWREDTYEFAIDPGSPDVVYAGNIGQGIFKSTDGGATWNKTNEGLAAVVPRELTVNPDDPDTIYVETESLGVLKSINGGHSWRSLGIFMHQLAVDPVTPTRVYIGGQGYGYIRLQISEDAGDTWHEVTATLPVTWSGWTANILEIAPHPNISGTILAGARFLLSLALPDLGTERGAIYSSDDYGEHWEYVGPTQPISSVVEIAYDTADPNLVYAATYGTGLWKSTDGGTSWGQVTSFPGVPTLWSVAVHPDVPNSVYVKCDRAPTGDPDLFISQDAGKTWEGLPPCEECGDLLVVPPDPEKPPYTLYAGPGSPYGLFRSTDGGYTWEQDEGAPITSIYSLAAGSDDERVVVYVGISGGVVSPQSKAAAASDIIPGQGEIKPGGVYRWTSLLLNQRVYLSLVLKEYTP